MSQHLNICFIQAFSIPGGSLGGPDVILSVSCGSSTFLLTTQIPSLASVLPVMEPWQSSMENPDTTIPLSPLYSMSGNFSSPLGAKKRPGPDVISFMMADLSWKNSRSLPITFRHVFSVYSRLPWNRPILRPLFISAIISCQERWSALAA